MKTFSENNISFSHEEFKREIAVMSMLRHEKLVLFYGACTQLSNLFILLELMRLGDLRKLLNDSSISLPFDTQVKLAADVAEAMAFLHVKGTMHRDLKSLNVLIDRSEDGSLFAKLSDFGSSKIFSPNKNNTKSVGTM